jgi:hypothetical protein
VGECGCGAAAVYRRRELVFALAGLGDPVGRAEEFDRYRPAGGCEGVEHVGHPAGPET